MFDELTEYDILRRIKDLDITPEFYCRAMVTYEFESGMTAYNVPLDIGNKIKENIINNHKRVNNKFNKELKNNG